MSDFVTASLRLWALIFTLAWAAACAPEAAPGDASGNASDSGPSAAAAEDPWPERKEDVAHILAKGEPLEPTPLDLSDEREYRYLINQLRMAGVTPDFAPQFFRMIEAERERHQDPDYVAAAHARSIDMMTADVENEDYLVPAVNLMTSVGNTAPTSSEVVTSGLSSVRGGTLGTHITLSLYDANNNLIAQGSKSSPSGQGQYTYATTSGSSDSAAVKSSMLYSYVANDGTFHAGTKRAATDDISVTIVNTAPTYTRAGVTTGNIVACMNRNSGQKSDCDYWQPQPHQIILPVQGSMDFNNAIIKSGGVPQNGNVYFMLVHPTPATGGGCVFPGLTTDQFFQNATYPDANTVAWNFNPQDFGQAQQCMPSGSNALFTLSIEVTVDLNGAPTPVVGAIASSGAAAVNDNVMQIPEIQILWGCLVEGTMVEMADGGFKPVEEIVAQQDRVVADADGATRLVTGTVHGTEDYVIRLTTSGGKTVSVTKNHPMVMAGFRIKLAREIGVGDEILTRDGLDTVTAAERRDYGGKVYNLVLEQTTEVERQRGVTLFADGVMVGDNHMQSVFEKEYLKRAETIHANAPIEWRVDNENILNRHAERGESSVY